MKPLARSRAPLYIGTRKKAFLAVPSGSSAWRFGVRIAWNIDEYVRRSLVTHHLHSIVEFSSSEVQGKDEDFASHRHTSNIEYAVKQAISQVQVYPEISPASHQSGRQASTVIETPALVAMGTKSSLLLTLVSPLSTRKKGCM